MSNPILTDTVWGRMAKEEDAARGDVMTVNGAVDKTVILTVVLLGAVTGMWLKFWHGGSPVLGEFLWWGVGGMVVALLAVLVSMFAPRIAMWTGLVYAVAEGIFLGALTMVVQGLAPGMPLIAACLTSACLLGMLLLYRTGVIKATPAFTRGVMIATAGLFLGTAVLFLLGMFGVGGGITGALYGNGWIGIGFSVLCIGLAALNLVIDFHFIEEGANQQLPKHMEWVAGFALLTTLVWLYIEILRLLMKLKSED
jgi:uncharacterized YccA/Bax inhibitor family protein